MMKERKRKDSRHSVLIGAVSILLACGLLTGCSKEKAASQDVAEQRESVMTADTAAAEETTEQPDKGQTLEEPTAEESEKLREFVDQFAKAYFSGDLETLQGCLTNPYEWDIEVYTGTEVISDFTVKGITTAEKEREETGSYRVASIEFKEHEKEERYQYLTIELMQQEDDWKVVFYGIE